MCRVGEATHGVGSCVVGSAGVGSGRPEGSIMKYVLAVLAVAIGIAAIVYGEADDSPGLQVLGAVLVVGAIAFGVRAARRT